MHVTYWRTEFCLSEEVCCAEVDLSDFVCKNQKCLDYSNSCALYRIVCILNIHTSVTHYVSVTDFDWIEFKIEPVARFVCI